MSEKLIEKSCSDFTEALASRAPVPGGGGAAALTGALGVALCSMAGNLILGRKKYAAVEADVQNMVAEGENVRSRLLELVDEDAAAFEPLAKAYSIPKEDPNRDETLEAVTRSACAAPLEMMRCCCRAIGLLEEMLDKGSAMLISDVGCGALCCVAALESASLNVYVNTRTLKDRAEAAKLETEADGMLQAYGSRAERIAREVTRRLLRKE